MRFIVLGNLVVFVLGLVRFVRFVCVVLPRAPNIH